MKILTLVALSLFTLAAQAEGLCVFKCEVSEPCQYSSGHDLGYCVSAMSLRFNDGAELNHAVIERESDDDFEVLNLAADFPVQAFNSSYLRGQSEDGDDWLHLSNHRGVLNGTVTLSEDFSFTVSCKEE